MFINRVSKVIKQMILENVTNYYIKDAGGFE